MEIQTESIEEYLKRGGKIRKVDFTDAYKKLVTKRHNLTLSKVRLTEVERQIKRDLYERKRPK